MIFVRNHKIFHLKDGGILTENKLYFTGESTQAEKIPFVKLESFHWESDPPYRPETYFKIYVENGVLTAEIKCYESNPRAVCTQTDDTVFKDSCVEFFFSPVEGRTEYINLEMNSAGTYLCEYGNMKPDRRFIKELTPLFPEVTASKSSDANGEFWAVKSRVSKELIAALYKVEPQSITFEKIRANIYKCGDLCEIKHYEAFSPVTTLPPGFHNPACFAEFIKTEIE